MNRPRRRRVATTSTILVAGLLAFGSTLADEVLDEVSAFDIPDQPLDQALLEFSKQADVQIIMAADTTRDLEAVGIHGQQRNRDALERLLADRGLQYTEHSNRTIAVHQIAAVATEGSSDSGKSRTTPRPVMMAQASAQQNQTSRSNQTNNNDKDEGEDKGRPRMEEIVVTGTRLKGIAPESAPVIVFEREDINRSGSSTVQEFFKTITQNTGAGIGEENYNVIANSGASINEQGASLNLRGLGNRATLTLLNGQRMAPTGLSGQTVDVSLIPLSAVHRIEILSVGASAIYGSDAVGGVVNFVLRDDFHGLETNLRLGTATNGDGNEVEVTQAAGDVWRSGNAMISYQYRSQDEVLAKDRDFIINSPDRENSFFLPASESHSVFASVEQEITGRLSLGLTGLHTDRDSQRDTINSAGLLQSNAADAQMYSLGADITYELSDDWETKLSASISRNNSETEDELEDGSFRRAATSEGNSREVTLTVAGSPAELPAGEISVAFGGQHRYSKFGIGIEFTAFEIPFAEKSIDSNAAFFEVLVPIVSHANNVPGIERLEFNAAVRYEDYGGSVGDTVNPMLGLLWSPNDELSFRSTYGTSFRAPLPSEINGSHVLQTFGNWDVIFADPNDPSQSNGVPLFILGLDANITPEESETFTVGTDYAPETVTGMELSATYFNTKYSDRIAQPAPDLTGVIGNPNFEVLIDRNPDRATLQALFDSARSFSDFRSFFEPNPTPAVLGLSDYSLIFDGRLANISITETSGIDVQGSYGFEYDGHSFNFLLNGTYLFSFDDTLAEGAPVIERLDTVYNPLDLKVRAGAFWEHKGITSNLFVNYKDGYDDVRFGTAVSVDSFTTVDLGFSYDFGAGGRQDLLSGTRISLNVLNAFDRDPPFVALTGDSGAAYDPTNASGRGRFVAASIRKSW